MRPALPLLLGCLFGLFSTLPAQVSAPLDSELCYVVGNGATFTDPSSPDLAPGQQGGIDDNYANCGCVTTTTLCGVDGSAVSVDFTSFATEPNWDWLVILDGNNPFNEELPYSLLDDPANVDRQLFNNAGTFTADPAYGSGAEAGIGNLFELPSTTFTATNATGCLTFVFRPDGIFNESGWIADVTVASGVGHPGDDLECGVNVNCLPPANASVSDIGVDVAQLSFNTIGNAQGYALEFGPAGFLPGTGTSIDLGADSTFFFTDLIQDTDYWVYLQSDCGPDDGTSAALVLEFSTLVSCPTVSNFDLLAVFASEALFGWNDAEQDGTYEVLVGNAGFDPAVDTTVSVGSATDDDVLVNGLSELLPYDAYLRVLCANGDTSNLVGPLSFATCARNDIGVVGILDPVGSCDLGVEQVRLAITNYGADPQSLFDFRFAVNGEEINVPRPQDGVFTDVLGKGDTLVATFDTGFDFSPEGTYEIAAWTSLVGDNLAINDTAFLTVVSIPEISSLPYFEGFETGNGGWTVEDVSGNSSWALGQPAGLSIAAAAGGTRAWVTNPDGNYNINEEGYLVSPCFNFAALSEDPVLSFALNYDTESCCDEGFVEVSTDGGTNWTKLGATDEGLNWYNDPFDDVWNGLDDAPEGWVPARHVLDGTAGSATVRLRFAFFSDFSVVREGFGIDNVLISAPFTTDLSPMGISTLGVDCGSSTDEVTLLVGNAGTSPVVSFEAAYRINDGPVVTETAQGVVVAPGAVVPFTFDQGFDSSLPLLYKVEAWVIDDAVSANDTTVYFFNPMALAPFIEDFEGGSLPAGWTGVGNQPVTDQHNNASFVVPFNLFNSFSEAELTTPRVGPLGDMDTLYFDYRYTDWSAGTEPTVLSAADRLEVDISTDCGTSYAPLFTLLGTDHVPSATMTTLAIDLADYAGQSVNFRVVGIYGAGDYWLDLDNFRVNNCPESLNLSAAVTDATGSDQSDGSATITVGAGAGPFTYDWGGGLTGATQTDLAPGTYPVTVTGAAGCTDMIEVIIGVTVGTSYLPEPVTRLRLQPNPTTGATLLNVELRDIQPVEITVHNSNGQTVRRFLPAVGRSFTQPLDLRGAAAGLYFVRLRVADRVYTERLVVLPR